MTVSRQPILLRPIQDGDPRLLADPQALALASRNAYPLVAQNRPRSDSMGLVAGGAIALALGGLTFWSMSHHRAQVSVPKPAVTIAAPPASAPVATPLPAPAPVLQRPAPAPVSAPAIAAAASPAMVFDASGGPATATAAKAPAATPGGKSADLDSDDAFALRVGGSADVVSAEKMANPSTTVSQGTLIPAVLETAIDTDLPGYVRAVVSRDVHSFDGTKILIPRSSRLIGQYKSGLAAGQTRAYVIWTRLIRPDGVSVSLGSPAVDYSGRAGLTGKVDSHFLKRFGSAVLLSVVGGLSSISNASVVVSGGQNAASVAAQRDTQIAPTVKVPQGQPIRVFTARDLDFSTVTPGG